MDCNSNDATSADGAPAPVSFNQPVSFRLVEVALIIAVVFGANIALGQVLDVALDAFFR